MKPVTLLDELEFFMNLIQPGENFPLRSSYEIRPISGSMLLSWEDYEIRSK
jgi:hypothetical protein